MAYTVLARKYRPQTFADLVGQEHVSRTLGNAIAAGRVAHAFLFTGPRGVGKTTSARILAKALNCENGPTASPCGVCSICTDITAGTDMDVLEMDGASNNSVEDVRRLQETIPFRPTRGRFRIIIVDEVHMLSTGAFNAFLKTLEEPPPHIKFIFATTEIHKVPVTVRSRCQRYDFRLIPSALIVDQVRRILAQESIEADEEALHLVARQARGSMRDALTLLDQLLAFRTEPTDVLKGAEIAEQLGIASRGAVLELAVAVLRKQPARVLELVGEASEQGCDEQHLLRQLIETLRDIVVLRVAGEHARAKDAATVELTNDEQQRVMQQTADLDVLELERAFAGVSKLASETGRSDYSRYVIEMGLVRLASLVPLQSLSEVVARVQALQSGAPVSPPTRTSAPAPQGRAPAPYAPYAPTTSAATPATSTRSAPTKAEPTMPSATVTTSASPAKPGSPASPAKPASPVSTVAISAVPQPAEASGASSSDAAKPGKNAPVEWSVLVDALRETRPAMAAVLEHASVLELHPHGVVLGFPHGSFFGKQAEKPEVSDSVAEVARAVWSLAPEHGFTVAIRFVRQTDALQPSLAQLGATREQEQKEHTTQKALSHPLVQEALKMFPASAEAPEVLISNKET
jgi:DNA polymerase-3 subunit gamma/tau